MRTTARPTGSNWDAIGNPIPGDVISCLEELGITFRVTDDEALALCPMHLKRTGKVDNHPSWSVRIEDSDKGVPAGTHNCLSCGYSGNFVLLVRDLLHIDWNEATRWVRARGGIDRARMLLSKDRHHEDPSKIDTSKQINEASLALYVDPPEHALKARNISLQACRDLGILWDKEKDLWITPIRDPDTYKLIGWQEKNERYFRNRPVDVQKSKTLFGLDIFDSEYAIVVESPLDVARMRTAGVTGGLSSYGVVISDAQWKLIFTVADKVILGLDNDRDGLKYSKMMSKLYAHRIPMYFLNYDGIDAKDVGEMTDDQILQAVTESTSSILTRFA